MTKTKFITCCLFFFFTLPAFAQESEGIQFFKGSFKKALAEAKQSGKLIFVHMYTTWSAGSKKMEEDVFPQKEVGDIYNSNFINLQVNAEKGEGWSLGDKYLVKVYPTYLYIDGDGVLVYKGIGYNLSTRFLAHADSALRKQEVRNTVAAYQQAFESRKSDKAFLQEYVNWLTDYNMPGDTIMKVLNQYFSLLKPVELKDSANADFLLSNLKTVHSPVFEYVIANQAFYRSFYDQFSKTLGNVILNSFTKAIDTKDDPLFWETLSASKKLETPSPRYPYSVFMFTNQYYQKNGQVKRIIERSAVFLDRVCLETDEEIRRKDEELYEETMDPHFLRKTDGIPVRTISGNRDSWRTIYSRYVAQTLILTAEIFLQHTRQKTELKKACRWAERGVELDKRNYKYYPVLSKLYAKAGMKREAIVAMQTAIALAQEQRAPGFVVLSYQRALQEL